MRKKRRSRGVGRGADARQSRPGPLLVCYQKQTASASFGRDAESGMMRGKKRGRLSASCLIDCVDTSRMDPLDWPGPAERAPTVTFRCSLDSRQNISMAVLSTACLLPEEGKALSLCVAGWRQEGESYSPY